MKKLTRPSSSNAARITRSSPDSGTPRLAAQLQPPRPRSSISASSDSIRALIATATSPRRAAMLGDGRRHLVGALVDVGDVEHRLRVRAPSRRGPASAACGTGTSRTGSPRPSASTTSSSQSRSAIASLSCERACLVDPLEPPLGLLEVGGEELGLDQVDVGDRVDPALGVGHAAGVVGADHVADRVGLADRGEEPVAEPLAGRGAANQAGDVVELDRLGHDLEEPTVSATASSRSSGTPTTATFGSIVVNG